MAELLPQSPCHFALKSSASVSQALWHSYLSHVIAPATKADQYYPHPLGSHYADTLIYMQTNLCTLHLRHHHRLANVPCAWGWRLYGINPAVQNYSLVTNTRHSSIRSSPVGSPFYIEKYKD